MLRAFESRQSASAISRSPQAIRRPPSRRMRSVLSGTLVAVVIAGADDPNVMLRLGRSSPANDGRPTDELQCRHDGWLDLICLCCPITA
jgi:hypothetical protein